MDTYDEYAPEVNGVNGYDEEQPALDARDFLGSAYLSKEDLQGDTRLRLIGIEAESIPGSARRKLVAQFESSEKRLILNSTNINRLVRIFGTTDTAQWKGAVILYVDPDVTYAGRPVGGIRVKPAASAQASKPRSNGTPHI